MLETIFPTVMECNDKPEPLIHEYQCRVCGKNEKIVIDNCQCFARIALSHADPICPECAEKEELDRIRAELSIKTEELTVKAGVPEEFLKWDSSKGNNALLKFCFSNLEKWAFIADRVDTGKTRSVCRAVKEVIKRNPLKRVKYYKINRLASEYAALSMKNYEGADRLVKELCCLDMLVLDDLGKRGRMSDSFCAFLYDVTNALYENNAVLWITANRKFSECGKYFTDDVFEAVYSRFGRQKNAGKYSGWSFGGVE